MDNNLLPFLPMLYIAWSDAIIDESELEIIRQKVQSQDALSIDERLVLGRWLDPTLPEGIVVNQKFLSTYPHQNLGGVYRFKINDDVFDLKIIVSMASLVTISHKVVFVSIVI